MRSAAVPTGADDLDIGRLLTPAPLGAAEIVSAASSTDRPYRHAAASSDHRLLNVVDQLQVFIRPDQEALAGTAHIVRGAGEVRAFQRVEQRCNR